MKIAVVHDHLGFRGGGERTALLLALRLKADFITAYADPETFAGYQKELGCRLVTLSKKVISLRVIRFFWLRILFWRQRRLFKNYDILIASGQTAVEAVASYAHPGALKIVYTHSTPRRIFDQYQASKKMYPAILRPGYAVFARFWKWLYLRSIKKYDINIANSENVARRIADHTGGAANFVIRPPVLTHEFRWLGQENYFFSWGRVDEAKRIELIVRAFKKLPEENLIIGSGGPCLKKVRQLARGADNIKVLGWLDEEELRKLAGRCRAAVYIPVDEDAGITHLEANAAGKPYLGVREGGLRETTVDGRTGLLVKADPKEEDIIRAVKIMTPDWCLSRREDCENQAKKFDASKFLDQMEAALKQNDPRIPTLGIDASRYEDPRFPGKGIRTGVENYAKNLMPCLVESAYRAGFKVRLYTPYLIKNLPAEIQKVIPIRQSILTWIFPGGWTKKLLSAELKNSPVDYFFTPSYYIPRHAPIKSAAVVHDVMFRSNPELYPGKERIRQEYALRQNISRAEKIFTVSDFTRNELIKFFKVSPAKVFAVPAGYLTQKNLNPEKIKKNQIIFIGRIEKKKSVEVLVRAFYEFSQSEENSVSGRDKAKDQWQLVLAGAPGHGYEKISGLINDLGLKNKVITAGYVSEEKKWQYLAESKIFVHPGAHEGSAMPLFEAWDAKIPAIIADTALMRELAGEAALFFRPGDAGDLAEKMNEVNAEPALKDDLIKKGSANLKNLSWKNTAEKILDLMR